MRPNGVSGLLRPPPSPLPGLEPDTVPLATYAGVLSSPRRPGRKLEGVPGVLLSLYFGSLSANGKRFEPTIFTTPV